MLCATSGALLLAPFPPFGVARYVRIIWNGAEVGRTEVPKGSQRPRFDFHVRLDFGAFVNREPPPPDALLTFEVWDWDRIGDDVLVSVLTLESIDVRRRCLLPDRRPQKLRLGAKPGASKKELAWAVGYLELQFDLASNVDYEGGKTKKAAASRSVKEIQKLRLAAARRQLKG